MPGEAAWRASSALLLVLSLVGCGSWTGQAPWTGDGPKPTGTPSPYLALFHENGFILPDDTQIAETFTVTLGGSLYQVLEYSSDAGSGLQIKQETQLLTDADLAFQVLLAYAWSARYHGLASGDIASLRELQVRIHNAEQEYQDFFRFAESLTPAMQKIDELKDKQITGVPVLPSPSLPIIDIANWWDLICTIPLDIFDLCLLEPLLREINEEGMEIERLLVIADADLAAAVSHLDAQSQGKVVEGLLLKETMVKAASSLDSLTWKLDKFRSDALNLQDLTRAAIVALETKQWGSKVDTVVSLLKSVVPDFDPTTITRGLLSALRKLDQEITTFLDKADTMTADIEARLALLTMARIQSEQALDLLSEKWRARPTAH